jgi:hypothetical protein
MPIVTYGKHKSPIDVDDVVDSFPGSFMKLGGSRRLAGLCLRNQLGPDYLLRVAPLHRLPSYLKLTKRM